MTWIRRGRAVAAVVAIALTMAACEEAEPAATSATDSGSTSTSSSSTTASPSTDPEDSPTVNTGTVNPLPGEAREQTKAGSLVFARFYLEQMGEAIRTRESATLRKYSLGCSQCEEFIAWIDYGRGHGVTANRNPYVVHEATILSSAATAHEIRARLQVQSVRTKDPTGPTGRAVVPSRGPEEKGETTAPDGSEESIPTPPGVYSEVPGTYSAVLSVAWVDGRWVVRGMSLV